MDKNRTSIMKKIYLFDWGDTIMKNFPDETGKMNTWQKVQPMPNAEKMLRELSKYSDCFIATNAKDSEKIDIIKALQRVGLNKYFKGIFCYKEIGFSKPTIEYFNFILDKLKANKDDLVMVGDNIESDITGARIFGIDTILYDPNNKHPNYKGVKIMNLIEIIEKIKSTKAQQCI